MSSDLRGQFIANTFQNLVQMPDVTKQVFYNGIGATISVINKDGIGTIKMFYPPSGNILDYFDNSGDGIVGTEWEGWSLCDGHTPPVGAQTPDLRGRFIVGYDSSDGDYNDIGNTNVLHKTINLTEPQLPQHTHDMWFEATTFVAGAAGPCFRVGNNQNRMKTSESTGNGDPIDIRPSYYTLAYVIRVS